MYDLFRQPMRGVGGDASNVAVNYGGGLAMAATSASLVQECRQPQISMWMPYLLALRG